MLVDAPGMVEREAIGDASAAVVPGEAEADVAELLHDLDHDLRHRALVVRGVALARMRCGRPAVAGQIGQDEREIAWPARAQRDATSRWSARSRE